MFGTNAVLPSDFQMQNFCITSHLLREELRNTVHTQFHRFELNGMLVLTVLMLNGGLHNFEDNKDFSSTRAKISSMRSRASNNDHKQRGQYKVGALGPTNLSQKL